MSLRPSVGASLARILSVDIPLSRLRRNGRTCAAAQWPFIDPRSSWRTYADNRMCPLCGTCGTFVISAAKAAPLAATLKAVPQTMEVSRFFILNPLRNLSAAQWAFNLRAAREKQFSWCVASR
jgi:hypothetical protein